MDPYVQQLADSIEAALPQWLRRSVLDTARAAGVPASAGLIEAADTMVREAAPVVLAELHELLATDVDAQRTNPLSILRSAVRFPTAVLQSFGVPPRRRDQFAIDNFPDDIYALSPATWNDVDESLQEPGIVWGAWKAKTVLDRRRGERGPRDASE